MAGLGRFIFPDQPGVFIREAQVFILPVSEAQGGGSQNQAIVINSTGRKDDLRITFRIRRNVSDTGMPNQLEFSVYNLKASTRQLLAKSGTNVVLQVGYKEGLKLQTVAKGAITSAVTTREGADYRTSIFCYDGLDGIAQSVSQRSYIGNTILKNIVKDIADDVPGLEVSEVNIKIDEGVIIGVKGRVLSGATPSILDKLAREFGFNWSVQNGIFKVVEDDFVDGTIHKIDAETGNLISAMPIINNVVQVAYGVDIQTVLDPRIDAGTTVRLKSILNPLVDGDYQTTYVTHIGDTHGEVWQTNIQSLYHQGYRNLIRTSANAVQFPGG